MPPVHANGTELCCERPAPVMSRWCWSRPGKLRPNLEGDDSVSANQAVLYPQLGPARSRPEGTAGVWVQSGAACRPHRCGEYSLGVETFH